MAISNEDVVKVSDGYFKDADDYRKGPESMWKKIWAIYNNAYDYSAKADWQAKGAIPKVPNAVAAISSFFKMALIRSASLFSISTDFEQFKPYTYPLEINTKFWLYKNKFPVKFSKSLLQGIIASQLIFKVWWEAPGTPMNIEQTTGTNDDKNQEKTDKKLEKLTPTQIMTQGMYSRGRLRIEPVDPFCFWLDPTGRNKYRIHRYFIDLYDLKELAKNPINGYLTKEVNEIETNYPKERDRLIKEGFIKLTHRKEVMIDEYYGDLVDTEGNLVERDATWSVANETHLIRRPRLFGESPFVWGPIAEKPFSVYHKSIIEDGYPLAMAITESMNLQQDSNSLSAAKAFEIDMDQIHDPEQIKSGMYPMKIFQKESDGSGNPLVTAISLGNFNPQILRHYQELDREYQNAVKMTEFLMGKPASRGRPTATEVKIKTGQSASLLQEMAITIEEKVITPLIEKIFRICMQKQGYYLDPRLKLYGDDVVIKLQALKGYDKPARQALLENTFNFKVDGISKIVGAMDEIQKIGMVIEMVGKTPMGAMLNIKGLLNKLIKLLGWDTKDIILEKPAVPGPGGAGAESPGAGITGAGQPGTP